MTGTRERTCLVSVIVLFLPLFHQHQYVCVYLCVCVRFVIRNRTYVVCPVLCCTCICPGGLFICLSVCLLCVYLSCPYACLCVYLCLSAIQFYFISPLINIFFPFSSYLPFFCHPFIFTLSSTLPF